MLTRGPHRLSDDTGIQGAARRGFGLKSLPYRRGPLHGRCRCSAHSWRSADAERELEGIREILSRGNGSDSQLRIFNANRDILEVTREISEATEAGVPVAT